MGIKIISEEFDIREKTGKALIFSPEHQTEPLEVEFHKDEESGEVRISYEDCDDLIYQQVTIRLADGNDSEYTGTFNENGELIVG